MATSGSGQGTPITVSTPMSGVYDQYEELTPFQNCAIPLSRYAKLIGYDETAFWGVVAEHTLYNAPACDPLWTEFQRLTVAQALAEAQQEIEQIVGYPLCPRWVTGTIAEEANHDDRWVDQQTLPSSGRLITRYSHLIEAGVRATAMIQAGAAVNHATDPAVVGPIATTVTNANEVKVFYPDSDRQITPSKVTISGGNLTIEIPRARMVIQDLLNNGPEGVAYDVVNNFLSEVDVVRIYNDPSVNAVLVRPHCENHRCSGGCTECTQAACMYIRDHRAGVVDVRPATWDAGTGEWKANVLCDRRYSLARLNYRCGVQFLNLQAEMAILRLAHTKMPTQPCSCDKIGHLWRGDNVVPEVLTRERLNCPFGLSNGAWIAWKFAQSLKSYRAAVL